MRKLEDGTYMYDTDSPWDVVWVYSFLSVAQALICVCFLYLFWKGFQANGWAVFQSWDGAGISCLPMVFVSFFWLKGSLKSLFVSIQTVRNI